MSSFESTETWYEDANTYWKGIPATIDGMLGGFGKLTDRDCMDSLQFIQPFLVSTESSGHTGASVECRIACGKGKKRVASSCDDGNSIIRCR
jgi:protein N-terminal methyltransferase